MPTFEVRLEDGRTLDIDAPNAKAAAHGAGLWAKANPNKEGVKPQKVTTDQMRNLAAGRNDAPVGKVFDPVGDFVGAMSGATENFVRNERARNEAADKRRQRPIGEKILMAPIDTARQVGDDLGWVADVAGVVAAPVINRLTCCKSVMQPANCAAVMPSAATSASTHAPTSKYSASRSPALSVAVASDCTALTMAFAVSCFCAMISPSMPAGR